MTALMVLSVYALCALSTARILWVRMVDRGWLGYESKEAYAARLAKWLRDNGDRYYKPLRKDPFAAGSAFITAVMFGPLGLLIILCTSFVARPTPGQREAARVREERAEELRLARIAVEAGLAEEVPDHLLKWEKEKA